MPTPSQVLLLPEPLSSVVVGIMHEVSRISRLFQRTCSKIHRPLLYTWLNHSSRSGDCIVAGAPVAEALRYKENDEGV